jgi:hypothetical protein
MTTPKPPHTIPVRTGDQQGYEARPDLLTRFRPGQSGNPRGRPKGSRHKLGEDFFAAMAADFEKHGPATIAKVRQERPADYLKIVASILPKELNVRTNPLEEMSDDELAAGIEILQSIIAAQGEGEDPSTRH